MICTRQDAFPVVKKRNFSDDNLLHDSIRWTLNVLEAITDCVSLVAGTARKQRDFNDAWLMNFGAPKERSLLTKAAISKLLDMCSSVGKEAFESLELTINSISVTLWGNYLMTWPCTDRWLIRTNDISHQVTGTSNSSNTMQKQIRLNWVMRNF